LKTNEIDTMNTFCRKEEYFSLDEVPKELLSIEKKRHKIDYCKDLIKKLEEDLMEFFFEIEPPKKEQRKTEIIELENRWKNSKKRKTGKIF